jgi:hypothetical protein
MLALHSDFGFNSRNYTDMHFPNFLADNKVNLEMSIIKPIKNDRES